MPAMYSACPHQNPGALAPSECTRWSGNILHYVSSSDEPVIISNGDDDGDEEVEELLGIEPEVVTEHLKILEVTSPLSAGPSLHSAIMC